MSEFYRRSTTVEVRAGDDIHRAVDAALRLSLERGEPVLFEFNATPLRIDAPAIVAEIVKTQFLDKRR